MGEEEFFQGAVVRDRERVNSEPRSRTLRAYRILVFVLILRPLGNLSLAFGMKHVGEAVSINPLGYLQAMLNPFVAAGIVMLVLGLLMRMALLSVADLSFVLPLTAAGYIISTFLGKAVLHEHVSVGRWLGTFLIFAGTAVVGSTAGRKDQKPVCENEVALTSA